MIDSIFKNDRKTESNYSFKNQEVRILEQFIEILFANNSEKLILRDKFMAENIKWVFNYENNNKIIFVLIMNILLIITINKSKTSWLLFKARV